MIDEKCGKAQTRSRHEYGMAKGEWKQCRKTGKPDVKQSGAQAGREEWRQRRKLANETKL
jgi:hypothetical protein